MNQTLPEQDKERLPADDLWSVLQAEKAGKPWLIRYRTRRPRDVDPAAFPFLLSATWAYQANAMGLPGPEELARMDRFEDALEASLGAARTAHLMVILTGNGERDWLWYIADEADAMQRANEALRGHPRYPLQFSVQPDAGWRAHAQFETGTVSGPGTGGAFGIIQRAIARLVRAFRR